jgi:hypothetical protein
MIRDTIIAERFDPIARKLLVSHAHELSSREVDGLEAVKDLCSPEIRSRVVRKLKLHNLGRTSASFNYVSKRYLRGILNAS